MPKLYNADPETGRYLSGRDSEARKNPKYNPITHSEADRYIYNRRTASLIQPPETGKNEYAFLENRVWVVKVDRVGQYYYAQDGTKTKITVPGVDIPDGCIQDDPPSVYHLTHDGTAWVLDMDRAKAAVKEAVQAEKKNVRDGGVTVDGTLFDTDAMARISYQEFAGKVAADASYTDPSWRASKGVFVTMDAALYAKVSAACEQLLANVYAWQNQQDALVDAATTQEQLDRISTEYE